MGTGYLYQGNCRPTIREEGGLSLHRDETESHDPDRLVLPPPPDLTSILIPTSLFLSEDPTGGRRHGD